MLTHELSIYKKTYTLVNLLMDYSERMPRLSRFTMGEKLVRDGLSLFGYITIANRAVGSPEERLKALDNFNVKFEEVKVLIRLAVERKVVTEKQAVNIYPIIRDVGKQVNGWRKSIDRLNQSCQHQGATGEY